MQSAPLDALATNFKARRARAPFGIRNIVRSVFIVSILLYPANGGLVNIGALGEARTEPYVVLNMLVMPISLYFIFSTNYRKILRPILLIAATFFFAIFITSLASSYAIMENSYKGEIGAIRLIKGCLIPAYGFFFAALFARFSVENFSRNILRPLFASAWVVAGVGIIEIFSWYQSSLRTAFVTLFAPFYSQMRRGETVFGRVQSVTFEASNFGFYVVMTLPLLLCIAYASRRKAVKFTAIFLFITLFVEATASGRTSVIGSVLSSLSFAGLTYALNKSRNFSLMSKIFVSLLIPLMIVFSVAPLVYISVFNDAIVEAMLRGDNLSNVSRFSTISMQTALFRENPLFGVGFNQYGFHVYDMLPPWAVNWETMAWLDDPNASFFPSFSIYSRLAAELGIVGLMVWVSIFSILSHRVITRANEVSRRGLTPNLGALILSLHVGLIFVGWTIASLKIMNIWMTVGLSVAYACAPWEMECALRDFGLRTSKNLERIRSAL